jgi:hypothetical protein
MRGNGSREGFACECSPNFKPVQKRASLPRMAGSFRSGRNRSRCKDWRQEWWAKVGKVVAVLHCEGFVQGKVGEQVGRLAVSGGLVPTEPTNGGIARGGFAERFVRALRDTSRWNR